MAHFKKGLQTIKKFSRNERTLEIMGAIAKLGTIVFLGVMAPNAAGHIIKLLGWVPDYKSRYRTEDTIRSLQKKDLIKFWRKDGKGNIELTKEGKKYFTKLKIKKIKLPRKANWDGFWRIITFDIPNDLNANRKDFSRFLSAVGMYRLEKSMYVFPHECKKEVFEIAELCEIKKYTRYILANKIDPLIELKREFPLTAHMAN